MCDLDKVLSRTQSIQSLKYSKSYPHINIEQDVFGINFVRAFILLPFEKKLFIDFMVSTV